MRRRDAAQDEIGVREKNGRKQQDGVARRATCAGICALRTKRVEKRSGVRTRVFENVEVR